LYKINYFFHDLHSCFSFCNIPLRLILREKVMTPSPFMAPDVSFQTNFTSEVERVGLTLKEKERRSPCRLCFM
jgi:hypothetical protein